MARPARDDAVERFRFRVTVVAIDLSVDGAISTIAGLSGQGTFAKQKLAIITRVGFSEVGLPSVTVNEMNYRENLDNQRFSKMAGLVKYDPVVLRRGVTNNDDLYNWYRLVNDDIATLNVAQEFSRDAKITISQSDNYRKDVIIEVLDRQGDPVKAWFLFNAWPNAYKAGNGLDAQAEDKLIEEMALTYESIVEVKVRDGESTSDAFARKMAEGAAEVVAGTLLDKIPFLR